MSQYFKGPKKVYLPDPTWGNHIPIVEGSGLEVVRYRSVFLCRGEYSADRYRYFDKKTVGLDFAGMKEDIQVRPAGLEPTNC